MTEQKVKVSAMELLGKWFDYNEGVFSEIFIQLFVEFNGTFNYRFFNEFHESNLSFAEINSGLLELTGSKKVPYSEPNEGLEVSARVFKLFKKAYTFGKFTNGRVWIYDVFLNTEVVLPRALILGWIAKQRPEQSTKSFAPINDGNLYHASEQPVLRPARKPASED